MKTIEALNNALEFVEELGRELTLCSRLEMKRGRLEQELVRALSAQPDSAPAAVPIKPFFAASIASRKWAELQEQGHRMQHVAFDGGPGGAGVIDPWGKVTWGPEPAAEQAEPVGVVGYNFEQRCLYVNLLVPLPTGTNLYTQAQLEPN